MRSRPFLLAIVLSLAGAAPADATYVTRSGSGAGVQAAVDQFRGDLGTLNPNQPGSIGAGRREINWDGVPDNVAAPATLPNDFFNVNSPRGVIINAAAPTSAAIAVSADSSNPTATPVEFGDVDSSYPVVFQTFSAQRLFRSVGSVVTVVDFFVPGTSTPATVEGFGVVFTDVDHPGRTFLSAFGPDGRHRVSAVAPTLHAGLSFVGVSGSEPSERFSRVVIHSGITPLGPGAIDGNESDVVAMDDFIYGEPVDTAPSFVRVAEPAYSVFEHEGVVRVGVARHGTISRPATVKLATTGGTAEAGADFTPVQTTVEFAAGEAFKSVPVTIHSDTAFDEPDEQFTVGLSEAVDAGVSSTPATVTVRNTPGPVPSPTATATATPTATPAPPAADTRAPVLSLGWPKSRLTWAQFSRGVSTAVGADEPVRLELSLRTTARRATVSAFNLELASATRPLAAGSRTVRLRPDRRVLGRTRRLTAQVRIVAYDAAGNRTTARRTIRVR